MSDAADRIVSADEYTPTTEEVRWYVSNNGRIPVEWFDRWLAAHDAEVAAKALKQITPLLAKAMSDFVDSIEHCDGGSLYIEPEDFAEVITAEYRKVATDE